MLSVSPQLLSVSVLPGGSDGRSSVGSLVTLSSETSGFLANGGETTVLSVFVLGGDDPVDAGISSDGLVGRVDKDDLEEFVGSVLTNPVGVEHSEVGAFSSDTLLGDFSVSSGSLELSDTLVDGLTIDATLLDGSLTATTSDTDSVNDVALLSAVTHLSGFIVS